MADIKWIKLATALPDNRKIKQIRKLPNGDTIALMWVFLMCLAGETNSDGMVFFTPEIPYTDEMLAEQFDIDVNTIRLGLNTFQRFGMIEIIDSVICLSSWEKWQAVDELAAIREQTRKRVARHREKQKLAAGNVTSNVTVTQCNATDIDKEKEKEGEKDKKNISDSASALCADVIACLNEKAGTKYKHTTKKTQELIRARMKEGFTLEDFQRVIETKCSDWKGTEYESYLRPETLFGTKFEGYLNAKPRKAVKCNGSNHEPDSGYEDGRYGIYL